MRESLRSNHRTGRTIGVAAALCTMVVVAEPASATPPDASAAQGCHIQGSWLGRDDSGPEFFIQFGGGANATSGPVTVQWITPPADSVTPGAGEWRKNGNSYDYAFVWYGLDVDDTPAYAVRSTGTDSFDGCDTLNYSGTLEIFGPPPVAFPWPLDEPHSSGLPDSGMKRRISF
jgi:hypothetical protein